MRVGARLAIGGAFVALAASGIWFGLTRPAAPAAEATPPRAQLGGPAPQIALPVVGGGLSSLVSDRGKVVLVNFWATWCEPCRDEMPALQKLADELRDRPFALYSVDLGEDVGHVEAFQREYGLRLYALLDEDGAIARAYGVRALPATFLIDQQGAVRQQRLGPLVAGGPDTSWSAAWLLGQVRALLGPSA